MEIVKQSWSFESEVDGTKALSLIERAGRTCWKSEDRATGIEATRKFVESIMSKNHESVLKHYSISARIITDRGVTHELVRHRLASYSQESTRYCNYSRDKFGSSIKVILPVEFYGVHDATLESANPNLVSQYEHWKEACLGAENDYFLMLKDGATPQLARSVLPNSLKTEVVMTANVREWRHFFSLRTSRAAHPQMRDLAMSMLSGYRDRVPVVFDDIAHEVL